jgi:hypothetical protein
MAYSCSVYGGVSGSFITRTREPEIHTGKFLVGTHKDRRCSNSHSSPGTRSVVSTLDYRDSGLINRLRQAVKARYKLG